MLKKTKEFMKNGGDISNLQQQQFPPAPGMFPGAQGPFANSYAGFSQPAFNPNFMNQANQNPNIPRFPGPFGFGQSLFNNPQGQA
jgi:hypothetical protein